MEQLEGYLNDFPGLFLLLKNNPLSHQKKQPLFAGLYYRAEKTFEKMYHKIDPKYQAYFSGISFASPSILFEETLLSLHLLDLVCHEDHQAFFDSHGHKITIKQFWQLYTLVNNHFPDRYYQQLQCLILINALKRLKLMPSFDPKFLDVLLHSGSQFADMIQPFMNFPFEYHHFIQGEFVANHLEPLQILVQRNEVERLKQQLVISLFELAGKQGYFSSIELNEHMFEVYQDCLMTALMSLQFNDTEAAYALFLEKRAEQLGFHLKIDSSWMQVFSLRCMCLLNIQKKTELKLLLNALDELWQEEDFVEHCQYLLSYQEIHSENLNLFKLFQAFKQMILKRSKQERYENILKVGLYHIKRVLTTQEKIDFAELANNILMHPGFISLIGEKLYH